MTEERSPLALTVTLSLLLGIIAFWLGSIASATLRIALALEAMKGTR